MSIAFVVRSHLSGFKTIFSDLLVRMPAFSGVNVFALCDSCLCIFLLSDFAIICQAPHDQTVCRHRLPLPSPDDLPFPSSLIRRTRPSRSSRTLWPTCGTLSGSPPSAGSCPRVFSWPDRPVPGKPCWQEPSQERLMCPSSTRRGRSSTRSSWVRAHAVSGICSVSGVGVGGGREGSSGR